MLSRSERVFTGWPLMMGMAVLLVSVLFSPLTANAAVRDMHFDLGTISKEGTGGHWKPSAGGKFTATYTSATIVGTGPVAAFGTARGEKGYSEVKASLGGVSFHKPSKSFTNTYAFSLHKDSSLNLDLAVGKYAVETNHLGAATAFVNNSLTVTLTGKNGFTESLTVTGGKWSNLWGKLKAGDYVLSISGEYGFEKAKVLGAFHQGYAGSFQVGDVQPGDVPLPGALVLLGTALAGAGVWGRRKKAQDKAV
ncbi:VPLPA-CTERM sorting domain-containing protein [Phaeovibrio sulfidiphilus]|uniref:VPLPA-CTERM sorting domain-containing protein n=1 Tax=Phaeovibrio sulfidiphilus TaxID=1220600 RepID=A0A8J6YPC2_9PROT|nr:VPLPA-CTERM sorting domain-containing protein [Phaeovibrio sulfidiphilus]MBE1236742.1 VPLPA-CTERM sorting domain-containing protein [Phaeovibrio sulfidiphilus]